MFRRANADTHLLLVIISFVASVLAIRAYLYLTGYPQIGGGGLHIAHMLWGGIALFAGSSLLLLYRGLFLGRAVAVMTGVGWGFFIDEVGKFITSNNNYFFAPAAVIIYIAFLGTVAVYLIWFRQRTHDKRSTDNKAFSDVRELMDGVSAGELTHRERELLHLRIERLKTDDEARFRDLGRAFETFVNSQPVTLRQRRLDQLTSVGSQLIDKLAAGHWFTRIIITLVSIDIAIGLISLFGIAGYHPPLIDQVDRSTTHAAITATRLIAELIIVIGLALTYRGQLVLGRRLMIGALLTMIIVLDSIDFYVSQFSASFSVMLDVVLLSLVEARFGDERLHPDRATTD